MGSIGDRGVDGTECCHPIYGMSLPPRQGKRVWRQGFSSMRKDPRRRGPVRNAFRPALASVAHDRFLGGSMTSFLQLLHRELKMLGIFKHAWIYLVGLFVSVLLILLFFHLNPSTEIPPL